jgi:hypothetical protein
VRVAEEALHGKAAGAEQRAAAGNEVQQLTALELTVAHDGNERAVSARDGQIGELLPECA